MIKLVLEEKIIMISSLMDSLWRKYLSDTSAVGKRNNSSLLSREELEIMRDIWGYY